MTTAVKITYQRDTIANEIRAEAMEKLIREYCAEVGTEPNLLVSIAEDLMRGATFWGTTGTRGR